MSNGGRDVAMVDSRDVREEVVIAMTLLIFSRRH